MVGFKCPIMSPNPCLSQLEAVSRGATNKQDNTVRRPHSQKIINLFRRRHLVVELIAQNPSNGALMFFFTPSGIPPPGGEKKKQIKVFEGLTINELNA